VVCKNVELKSLAAGGTSSQLTTQAGNMIKEKPCKFKSLKNHFPFAAYIALPQKISNP
jgi:hypothetical protein